MADRRGGDGREGDGRLAADLAGRTALVTGASQGLGLAIAGRLAEAGARVVLTSEDGGAAARAAAGIGAVGARLDVRSRADHEAVLAEHGPVDILVNNAAVTVPTDFFAISDDEWARVLDVNLRGAFVALQVFGSAMAERGWGRIVNHASIAGQQGGAVAGAHYAAAKAGLIVLTKIVAARLAPRRVTVNAIAPAAIEGPAMATMPAERVAAVRSGIPVGRFGTAEEVAGAVLYLCSADAGYVTGTTVDVNGGLHMR